MTHAGEDPAFLFRRMIILASEDVGMADPNAINVVISCAEAFDRIGFPEGNFPLAQACIYLATAPKSNTSMSFFDAKTEVEQEDAEVPNHLRDASRDKEGFGHGEGYIYPHAYRDHWAAQQYLPTALRGKIFYTPSRVGYEGKIREEVMRKRELQAAIVLGENGTSDADGEFLSWSASSKGREGWFKRLESGRSALLLSDRDAILGTGRFPGQRSIARHDRILIPAASDGLLLWESLRRAPEGLTAALVETPAAREALLRYAAGLDEIEQPLIAVRDKPGLPGRAEAETLFGCGQFDYIAAREPWRRGFAGAAPSDAFAAFADASKQLLDNGGDLSLLQSPPRLGERLSRVLAGECAAPPDLTGRLEEAETAFFSGKGGGDIPDRLSWDEETLKNAFTGAGFTVNLTVLEQKEERLLTGRDLGLWFDKEKSSWGSFVYKNLGKKDFETLRTLLAERVKQGPILWKWRSLLLKAT
jgi:putative ATPase